MEDAPELRLSGAQLAELLAAAAAAAEHAAGVRQRLSEAADVGGALAVRLPLPGPEPPVGQPVVVTAAALATGAGLAPGTALAVLAERRGSGGSALSSNATWELVPRTASAAGSASAGSGGGGGGGAAAGPAAAPAGPVEGGAAAAALSPAALVRVCALNSLLLPLPPGHASAPSADLGLHSSLPLWLLPHAGGGQDRLSAGLAAHLPFPVWGLELPQLEPPPAHLDAHAAAAALPSSLDGLAALLAGAVVALQPHGPYALAGQGPASCCLALAVAARLEAAHGAAVVLVCLDGAPTPLMGQHAALAIEPGAPTAGCSRLEGGGGAPSSSLLRVVAQRDSPVQRRGRRRVGAWACGAHGGLSFRPAPHGPQPTRWCTGSCWRRTLTRWRRAAAGPRSAGPRCRSWPPGPLCSWRVVSPPATRRAWRRRARPGGPRAWSRPSGRAAWWAPWPRRPTCAASRRASGPWRRCEGPRLCCCRRTGVAKGGRLRWRPARARAPDPAQRPLPAHAAAPDVPCRAVPRSSPRSYGSAFLEAARRAVEGPLTAASLDPRHGSLLAWPDSRAAAAGALAEAVAEMLQQMA
jgi:hypothetical protein